ncbi:MAG: sigma factor-like helix-turn-helix DNA-binding protein [Nitrospinota bacterium]
MLFSLEARCCRPERLLLPIGVARGPKGIPLRRIVELRLQGLSHREIARTLGVSKQAIQQRLSGILEKIDGDRLDVWRQHRVAILEQVEEYLVSALADKSKLAKASINNIAYAFTQIFTARRLEAGQSTQNLSLHAVVAAVEGELADRGKQKLPEKQEDSERCN